MSLSEKEIARRVFEKRKDDEAFHFRDGQGRILASVRSLSELISVLSELHPLVVKLHIQKTSVNDLFELSKSEVGGLPVVRSDVALWVSYVLGDKELAVLIARLGSEISEAETLKKAVLEACKKRERVLREALL